MRQSPHPVAAGWEYWFGAMICLPPFVAEWGQFHFCFSSLDRFGFSFLKRVRLSAKLSVFYV